MTQLHIGIIGAGATGLAAAWDLVRAGHQVTIFEAADRVGGLAAGFKDDNWDWTLEKFYHHWFANDHDILNLAEEMGVRDKVVFPRPKTSYWLDGKHGAQRDLALGAVVAAVADRDLAYGFGGTIRQALTALAALREGDGGCLDAALDGGRSL